MENIDLILTTGNVSMNLPYIAVSLFCDETDIATIRHYLKNLRKHKHMNPKDISICFEECDFKTNQYAITMHTVFGSIVIQKVRIHICITINIKATSNMESFIKN